MTMPTPPLGRSLIPLPGESLPGFILRLSCRLQLPPARLAALTGLVPAGHSGARAPVSLLTEIPEPARRTFARMTRLTTGKVAQLGLACLQERYPLPAGAAKNPATVPLSGLLVFAPATRYCPDCLAGDGSPIQDAFGGPWRTRPDAPRDARRHAPPLPMPDGARSRQGPDPARLLRHQTRPHPGPPPGRP